MLELVQVPWVSFCLVQKRILEFSGAAYKLIDIPPSDRSLVWRLTRQRYYQVPVLRDGRTVIFETSPTSQVIAKYLEVKLDLGLFPRSYDGLQEILWRYIESEVQSLTHKLNASYYRVFVPAAEQLNYVRFQEQKFGPGCLRCWAERRPQLLAELARRLMPFEQMLADRPYLLDGRPRFVDFDLWGMLASFLYSGRYRLPARHGRLRAWYKRMSCVTLQAMERGGG
jgi:glutathione S-transferase